MHDIAIAYSSVYFTVEKMNQQISANSTIATAITILDESANIAISNLSLLITHDHISMHYFFVEIKLSYCININ